MTKSLILLQRLEASWSPVSMSDDNRQLLETELNDTLTAIANCDSLEAAEPLLRGDLEEIQGVLATLWCRRHVELSERQREIVREFDRCDDPEVRRIVFENIKHSRFPWCTESSAGQSDV